MTIRPVHALIGRIGLALALAMVIAPASPASATTSRQASDVYDLQKSLAVVQHAQGRLSRAPNGLTAVFTTTGLHGGHAYTMWCVVFDHPEFCNNPMLPGLRCGFLGLHFPDFGLNGDPRAAATILHAAGHVVGTSGKASFGAHLGVGKNTDVVIGTGLTNPAGAEVILDVLDHGSKDPGNVPAQIHEFVTAENSCNPACADHQLAGFAP